MTQTSLPSYTEINQALNETANTLHPSQVHGLICGTLCGNPTNQTEWEQVITGATESAKTHTLLQQLYQTTLLQLQDYLFDFQLVLPSDDDPLPARAEALTLWCQGYLTGLQQAHVKIMDRESSEATEAINDLIEIAKMNYEDVVASDEDEAAYIELVEYVRMGIIVIYQELKLPEESKLSSDHLH